VHEPFGQMAIRQNRRMRSNEESVQGLTETPRNPSIARPDVALARSAGSRTSGPRRMKLAPGQCLVTSGGMASSTDAPPTNDAPKTPAKTKPLGEAQLGAWFEGPDVVTALRIFDGDREYALSSKSTFTLGASRSCDVPVIGHDLSALHCAFERKGTRLR